MAWKLNRPRIPSDDSNNNFEVDGTALHHQSPEQRHQSTGNHLQPVTRQPSIASTMYASGSGGNPPTSSTSLGGSSPAPSTPEQSFIPGFGEMSAQFHSALAAERQRMLMKGIGPGGPTTTSSSSTSPYRVGGSSSRGTRYAGASLHCRYCGLPHTGDFPVTLNGNPVVIDQNLDPVVTCCPNARCKKPLPKCMICQLPLKCAVKKNENLIPLGDYTVFCMTCHHGGHLKCVQAWKEQELKRIAREELDDVFGHLVDLPLAELQERVREKERQEQSDAQAAAAAAEAAAASSSASAPPPSASTSPEENAKNTEAGNKDPGDDDADHDPICRPAGGPVRSASKQPLPRPRKIPCCPVPGCDCTFCFAPIDEDSSSDEEEEAGAGGAAEQVINENEEVRTTPARRDFYNPDAGLQVQGHLLGLPLSIDAIGEDEPSTHTGERNPVGRDGGGPRVEMQLQVQDMDSPVLFPGGFGGSPSNNVGLRGTTDPRAEFTPLSLDDEESEFALNIEDESY
ncbi:unnamed protein product [Amoebophrya sp. A120]|nr:unnamed protein product [Amoebophrya sp. A120]|eukprot:GSA120T00024788001.1